MSVAVAYQLEWNSAVLTPQTNLQNRKFMSFQILTLRLRM